MNIPRDGHCLFLACIEAMAHHRLKLPPAWLSTSRQDQHRKMQKALLNTCKNDFHTDQKYSIMHGGLLAASELNKGQTLFQDMCNRLQRGEYGQQSELALIACKYNLEEVYTKKIGSVYRSVYNTKSYTLLYTSTCRCIHFAW